jgi:hypothetical protein
MVRQATKPLGTEVTNVTTSPPPVPDRIVVALTPDAENRRYANVPFFISVRRLLKDLGRKHGIRAHWPTNDEAERVKECNCEKTD